MNSFCKPTHDLVLGGAFTIPSYGMVSAQGEASGNEWKVAVGKSGKLWLYHPDRSMVWVSGGKGSHGCGGNTVDFPLAGGLGKISLVGPWCSNADACFVDTGIDVRNNFVTWGCVGTGREYDANTGSQRITGLVYFDRTPTKGAFDRVDLLAWEMQEKEPDLKLFSYRESEGGSSCGPVGMPYRVRVERGLQKER